MSAFTSPPDEGFSEYPMESQNTSDSSVAVRDLPSYIAQMSVQDRAQLAVQILNGLPASDFSRVIEAMKPRLFINFFHQLPSEICLKILGFLDPDSLIRAAQASQEWMAMAMDPHLWQQLYYREGWRTIQSEIKKFEIEQASSVIPRRPRSLGSAADGHTNKKRATGNSMRDNLDEIPSYEADLFTSGKGKGPEQNFTEDEEMPDAEQIVQSPRQSLFGGKPGDLRGSKAQRDDKGLFTDSDGNSSGGVLRGPRKLRKSHTPPHPMKSLSEPSPKHKNSAPKGSRLVKPVLYLRDPDTGRLKLNWHHLYTQRRRLESNWEAGKYVNFQLPHPDHPDEAHGECVYTIQYSGQYLVSGSRDTTVRIWNLDTRRLVRPPLRGHRGSVLCLQFDADPEEDIIVSGSSDSDVIVWKFSTGQQIQRLSSAHRESVLNVRFDKRILVTCSKDNTIKIFNRRPISHDPNSQHTQGIDYVPKILNNFGFNPAPSAGISLKPAYSLIGCLDGHQAAVNAVQILKNEIVSASGDRTVKVWDWPRGVCTRNLIGHNKGIACVQYDGRRIVSGSSDNEVKVFDSETGVEVASLRGHTNLVRTVQAGFGDLPHSIEEDQEEAKATDAEYFEAVRKGLVVTQQSSNSRRRRKNPGSRNPEDITAIGAKLPPGGGGGRYGRIVSGSYDETVIIWRRDKSGVWKPQHTLRQEEAARAAARQARPRPVPTVARLTQNALDTFDMPSTQAGQPSRPTPTISTDSAINVTHSQAEPSNQASSTNAADSTTLPITAQYMHHFQTLLQTAITAGPDTLRTVLDAHPILLQLPTLPALITGLPSHGLRNEIRNIVNASRITNAAQLTTTMNQLQNEPNAVVAAAQAAVQMTLAVQVQQQQVARDRLVNSTANARVFKLQFDARRIVCCSQMRVIVGWDFGVGDEEIVEAARFFAPVE